jgi:hypothetical protein
MLDNGTICKYESPAAASASLGELARDPLNSHFAPLQRHPPFSASDDKNVRSASRAAVVESNPPQSASASASAHTPPPQ